MSFLAAFFHLVDGTDEHAVCCPFPHTLPDGTTYLENRPSAHVNTTKFVFNCKACGRSYNEHTFIPAITGCPQDQVYKMVNLYANDLTTSAQWGMETEISKGTHDNALSLGISEQQIEELQIKTKPGEIDTLAFPVFTFGNLVDIRVYDSQHRDGNKIKSVKGACNGMIIPFDLWRESDIRKTTLICAGEKDMAVARSNGFNAITITGGERALPKFLKFFNNRKVAIVYDNDETGINGANKLAEYLLPHCLSVKVVTNFHEVCVGKGEDITDYFTKYGKSRQDLINCIKATPEYTKQISKEEQLAELKNVPSVDLYTASQQYVNKIVKSNIQVVAVSETAFRAPTKISGVKKKNSEGEAGTMKKGDVKTWEMSHQNCEMLMYAIDNNLKEEQIKTNIRKVFLGKAAERNLDVLIKEEVTVYKVTVTDLYETVEKNVQPMEYIAYSIDCKLDSGKKYEIYYKLAPHPLKGGQLTMIILHATQASDSLNSFKLTPEVIDNLRKIQNLESTVEDKIKTLVEMNKEFIGYDGLNKLIETIDLSFNTPLRFNFGRMENIRGYLDTLIVGESRTGKSSTADALRKLYELGTFTSLAGNSATIPGLVGGSSKSTSGSMQTRAGVIPQNHMGLIIFEEFGKSNKDVLKELTDIRSSNEVRIARVSGTTVLPALVRMIALTNTKTNGEIKSIASYPNGISIITELVNTAEDIARYDIILVMAETGLDDINPLWEPIKALPKECYKDRIRWIWTRTAEQIDISPELQKYIIDKSNELNRTYPSHIKLFGTEAWKKISRLAIAVAGYTVSASDNYEHIVVLKEHIDYAIKFLVELYDNSTFKFKEYVDMELRYRYTNDEAVVALQRIFKDKPNLVLQLEQHSIITRSLLESTTGLDATELRKGLQDLTKGYFIKVDATTINPTERFRNTVTKINRNSQIDRIGEGNNVTIQMDTHNNNDQSSS